MRVLRWCGLSLAALFALGVFALAAWHGLDRGPRVADARETETRFDLQRLLVLTDADMAATAYADGRLAPRGDLSDALVVLGDPVAGPGSRQAIPASNSVMGWPGAMTAAPDGRHAYVVETRGPIDRGVERLDNTFADMPEGERLTTIDLDSGEVVDTRPVCRRPNAVDIAPSGDWLLVACGVHEGELAVVTLDAGRPARVQRFDLHLPGISARPGIDDGLSYARIHPDGTAAGIIQANLGVSLVRFRLDADGIPEAASAEPPRLEGDWLTAGRWTRTGGHFLVADVRWGPSPAGALFVRDGAIHSFALSPSDESRGIVSSARVSKSPEGFELNRTGDLLVAVNMERTYLPGGPFALAPGRSAASLSLVSIDAATGMLETLDEPVGFHGVLPEDAVFDRDGDRVAVAVFQDHDDPASDGWVEIFALDRSSGLPRLVPTGQRLPMPRGAHDLVAID